MPTVRVAAVQAMPVVLDLEASLYKALVLLADAAGVSGVIAGERGPRTNIVVVVVVVVTAGEWRGRGRCQGIRWLR